MEPLCVSPSNSVFFFFFFEGSACADYAAYLLKCDQSFFPLVSLNTHFTHLCVSGSEVMNFRVSVVVEAASVHSLQKQKKS